jgi:hypothetical protein
MASVSVLRNVAQSRLVPKGIYATLSIIAVARSHSPASLGDGALDLGALDLLLERPALELPKGQTVELKKNVPAV